MNITKFIIASLAMLAIIGCSKNEPLKIEAIPGTIPTTSNKVSIEVVTSGLTGPVILKGKSGEKLTVSTNGTQTFELEEGSSESDVAALTLPDGQICGVSVVAPQVKVACRDIFVMPLYQQNGVKWNDYVKFDGASTTTATDFPCQPMQFNPLMGGVPTPAPGGYQSCIHGGEFRRAPLPEIASCEGLSAKDSAGALQWKCEVAATLGGIQFVSTGLAPGKRLWDLIEESPLNWKQLSLSISKDGVALAKSNPAIWWPNQVINANFPVTMQASNIYVGLFDPIAFRQLTDKVALVLRPGTKLRPLQPGGGICIQQTAATTQGSFMWLEGDFESTPCSIGIMVKDTSYSVFKNVRIHSAALGIRLENASNNRFEDITVSNVQQQAIQFLNSRSNTLARVQTFGMKGPSNMFLAGIKLESSNDNVIIGGYSFANTSSGIFLDKSSGMFASDITLAQNTEMGLTLMPGSSRNTVMNLAAIANQGAALQVAGNAMGNPSLPSRENQFVNLALHGSNFAVNLFGTDSNRFTGLLKVANSGFGTCNANGNRPGLLNGSCSNDGSYGSNKYINQDSDATFLPGLNMTDTFVGRVTETDLANASNAGGAGTGIVDSSDWISFAGIGRGWGVEPLFGMGNLLNTFGNCVTAVMGGTGSCRIWDWNPLASDQGDLGPDGVAGGRNDRPAVLGQVACPKSSSFQDHTWFATTQTDCEAIPGAEWKASGSVCRSHYLKGAIELVGSGGNDNHLCEAGETCIYTPNIGAYQGHGELVAASDSVDNTLSCASLSNVTLKKFSHNGY